MHFFERRSLVATPWKNGGGLTREIVCQPPGTALLDFDWRVSIAQIASDGPFSAFPGIDRVITLLDGAGVQLESGGVEHRLDTPLRPFAFAGDWPLECHLLAGPCDDLNVMTRRGVCRADVQVLRQGEFALASARGGLLLALAGRWHGHVPGGLELAAGQGLWWQGQPLQGRLSASEPDAALIAVRILELER
jgi:environmental stress-induced protein Ves